jgi:hypothetical protein
MLEFDQSGHPGGEVFDWTKTKLCFANPGLNFEPGSSNPEADAMSTAQSN